MTTGWTIMRGIYVLMGAVVIANAIQIHQWLGVVFGLYFVAMGLFSFGCASGTCYSGTSSKEETAELSAQSEQVEYEEIKLK